MPLCCQLLGFGVVALGSGCRTTAVTCCLCYCHHFHGGFPFEGGIGHYIEKKAAAYPFACPVCFLPFPHCHGCPWTSSNEGSQRDRKRRIRRRSAAEGDDEPTGNALDGVRVQWRNRSGRSCGRTRRREHGRKKMSLRRNRERSTCWQHSKTLKFHG